MCRQRQINENQVDNTAAEQYNQLLEQLQSELNELLETTTRLQEESVRLELEARKLIDQNIQVQLEARLSKEKCRYQRRLKHRHRRNQQHGFKLTSEKMNFQQLKQQIYRQRQSFLRFERRLRAKYEKPLRLIVSKPVSRRIRQIPSESID